MITIKNKAAIRKMEEAGALLVQLFEDLAERVRSGVSTGELDAWIADSLIEKKMLSRTKGYMGYNHVSCISVNDEIVHGVPRADRVLRDGDLVSIDVCASYKGYCADMARTFGVGKISDKAQQLKDVVQAVLDKGIDTARAGNHLTDISAAIQGEAERHGFGVIRDFAGHGIGKAMHESPEILNYGAPGQGPKLMPGMTFALEPMITIGGYEISIGQDGWTAKTKDGSLAAHVEDTIAVTEHEPKILTRMVGAV